MEEHIIADKTLIRTAKVISAIFTPFSIPFLAFLILFIFSYLRIMPLQYKLIVLGVVYCFTILMPTLTIFIFRKINGFSPEELVERKRRYIPFILTITSYVFCLLMMHRLNIPWYMTGIILSALVVMIICVIVNLKWKLSEHMAGRSRNWRTGSFQRLVQLQSRMVAMPLYTGGWRAGHRPHHPATPHTGRSYGRLCRRAYLLVAGTPPAEQHTVPNLPLLRALFNF